MTSIEELKFGAWPTLATAPRSLWLDQALASECETPGGDSLAIQGSIKCDVCIVGGGYTGLWTALRLSEIDPACHVVMLEADICGSGASGRNGGITFGWWAKFPALVARHGQDVAIELCRQSAEAVRQIGTFALDNEIDCHFAPGGWIWGATSEIQSRNCVWASAVTAVRNAGCDDVFVDLDADELTRRMGTPFAYDGILDSTGATVHPALLARGLRRVALERGVEIYEHSPVVSIDLDHRVRIASRCGQVEAERAVLATNAWISRLPNFRRSCVPISSDVVATQPAPTQLSALGWRGNEAVSNSRMMVNYYRPTQDHRVILGRGGGSIAFAGRIDRRFAHSQRHCQEAANDLHTLMPSMANTPISHSWSGPIDRSASGMPWFGRLEPTGRLLFGVGFSGNGIAPSLIAGRILASLASDKDDEWASSPLISPSERGFPPEPFRFLGGVLIRSAVKRKESAEDQGKTSRYLDRKLATLAPAGIYEVE